MILAIVYVSEAARKSVASALLDLASNLPSRLLHTFEDIQYNRTSFFFASELNNAKDLTNSIIKFSDFAFKVINFIDHVGCHPTLGSLDHICISPLGDGASIDEVAGFSQQFAIEYSDHHKIPVFCYGKASSTGRKLKDIRKSLGYFTNPLVLPTSYSDEMRQADHGASHYDPAKGMTCIGMLLLITVNPIYLSYYKYVYLIAWQVLSRSY